MRWLNLQYEQITLLDGTLDAFWWEWEWRLEKEHYYNGLPFFLQSTEWWCWYRPHDTLPYSSWVRSSLCAYRLPVGLFLLLWSLASNMPWLLFAPGLGVGAIHSWWCSPASCWDYTIWSSPLFLLPCEFPFLVVNTSLGSFVCFLKQSIVAATLPLWNAV